MEEDFSAFGCVVFFPPYSNHQGNFPSHYKSSVKCFFFFFFLFKNKQFIVGLQTDVEACSVWYWVLFGLQVRLQNYITKHIMNCSNDSRSDATLVIVNTSKTLM
jgi:hypothetical protein